MNANIIHHGAFQGVTGSCHQLFIDELNSLLIDCGLFQGAETAPDGVSGADRLEIPFPVEGCRRWSPPMCTSITWAAFPGCWRRVSRAPSCAASRRRRCCPVVLEDAFAVGVTRDARLVERYLKMVEARIRPMPWRTWYPVFSGPKGSCRIRLQRAGHILGSAYVECELTRPGGERLRVLFSGDLGAPYMPAAVSPQAALVRRRGGAGEHLRRSGARKAQLRAGPACRQGGGEGAGQQGHGDHPGLQHRPHARAAV
jgi:metallo-beta-lactamase family protein